MPETITAYTTFSPGTKARSAQVNANFANYRGSLLPINADTITASQLAHNLGSSDHQWKSIYAKEMLLYSATGASAVTVKTPAGIGSAYDFILPNTLPASSLPVSMGSGGTLSVAALSSAGLDSTLRTMRAQTYTANGNWTCPAGVNVAIVAMRPGSGGGAGSDVAGTGYGGGGGAGAMTTTRPITVVPTTVYAMSIGAAGAAGGAASAGGSGGNSSFGGLWTLIGAPGGGIPTGGAAQAGGGGAGGDGGTTAAASSAGQSSVYASGGSPGADGDGGGGGGAGDGAGGAGGLDTAGSAGTNGGGGGGGGGAGGPTNKVGGAGSAGHVTVYWLE